MLLTRSVVEKALTEFEGQTDFRLAATRLFGALGYESTRTVRLNPADAAGFIKQFSLTAEEFDPAKAHTDEWAQFEFLFQFGDGEVKRVAAGNPAVELFNQATDRSNKNSFFFHAVRLKGSIYRRGVLADITRQLNRPFGLPTVVLFQHGDSLSLSVIGRRANKKDATRDVLEKVTLIKDINLAHPHPAHVRILDELRLGEQVHLHKVSNFDTLLLGWQATLSISELNKRFYRELANWYFWAVREVRLPAYPGDQGQEVRHATAMIRLITRIIFTWFLKEKDLVPADLFRKDFVYGELLAAPAGQEAADEHSSYYKAVLQNLFFATLNTEMRDADGEPNRCFLPPSNARNQNAGYGEAGFLRYQDLFTEAGQQRMLDLVNGIPFLNGGLFECLDPTPAKTEKGQPKPVRVLIDCFSNGNQHLLHVPDKLFFADAQALDLSTEYGEKTRRKETVRGLLPLLGRYKFTIAENTPLEEEVALDPELLGKVFENLLAAYNPETQTTARKQTGSFYTPREVVEYMVDESLLAYLRPHLPTGPVPAPALTQTVDQPSQNLFGETLPQQATLGLGRPATPAPAPAPTAEADLRYLLTHPEAQNPFDAAATWQLIQALDGLKLLDPACGSGAFPMGALQRLTYLLARLDPNNKLWKQQQLDRAKVDKEMAKQFLDEKLRQQALAAADRRIAEITNAFNTNNHELDYARKLYLIENCLYGVDIQPVAVQITKLRCFIALLVEQKADTEQARQPAHNLGIRPLPNLETKFVAANTLLRLEEEAPAARRDIGRQAGLLSMDDGVDNLRRELRGVRHEYFTVRGRADKLRLRAQDADLRHRLGQALTRSGMPAADARHLADWNPYDLKTAADFFSPKWMLGVDDGFDMVIGNPPYIKVQNIPKNLTTYYKSNYEAATGKYDLYVLFMEVAFRLSKRQGVTAFINPHRFLVAEYGIGIREILTANTALKKAICFGVEQIFETATTYTGIFFFEKESLSLNYSNPQNKDLDNLVFIEKFYSNANFSFNITTFGVDVKDSQTVLDKIYKHPQVSEIFSGVYQGIIPMGDDIQVMKGTVEGAIFNGYSKALSNNVSIESALMKPILKGENIQRYLPCTTDTFIFNPHYIDSKGKTKPYSEIEMRRKFPLGFRYISNFKEQLIAKKVKYKTNPEFWFSLHRSREQRLFEAKKLITPQLQNKSSFTLDENRFYADAGGYLLVHNPGNKTSLAAYLGVFNSTLFYYFIRKTSTPFNNGYYYFKTNYIEPFGIPDLDAATSAKLENFVNQILAAKAALATADTTVLERQVDALVYKLYDLTEDEIALVEGRSA